MDLQSTTHPPAEQTAATAGARYAYFALAVLTLINFLNYIDRFIFASLIPYIKDDVGYSDLQFGLVGSAFTYVYTICSPLFGYLGDRYRRGRLIALGIGIWSLATAAGGSAGSFAQLLAARSVVGVGEANYATITPGLLSDFFVKARRGLVMSIFFATIPIGAAMGFIIGGYFGAPGRLGWRHTLYLVGLPGLLMALAAYAIREPKRGAMDEAEASSEESIGFFAGYRMLLTNRGFLFSCFGYAALTFALGALVFWAPQWLKSDKGMSADEANYLLGLCSVVGGFLGTMSGGVIADFLARRIRGAFFWVCAASSILAAIPTVIAIVSSSKPIYLVSIFLGVMLAFVGNGPVNALQVNLVPAKLRTTAMGFVVVIMHVLGDLISVSLVGFISTWLSRSKVALPATAVTLGHIFHIDPGRQTLSMALLLMPAAFLVSGILYAIGLLTPEGKRS